LREVRRMNYLERLNRAIDVSDTKKKKIARELDIKYDTLRKKLKGESPLTVDELLTITKTININIMEVFKNE
jgi:predicted transcriptional regulator